VQNGIDIFLQTAGIKLPVLHLSDPETLALLPAGTRVREDTAYFVNGSLNPKGPLIGRINATTLFALFSASAWVKIRDPYFVFLTERKIHAQGFNELFGWYLVE
jgi:hypothetical protein